MCFVYNSFLLFYLFDLLSIEIWPKLNPFSYTMFDVAASTTSRGVWPNAFRFYVYTINQEIYTALIRVGRCWLWSMKFFWLINFRVAACFVSNAGGCCKTIKDTAYFFYCIEAIITSHVHKDILVWLFVKVI